MSFVSWILHSKLAKHSLSKGAFTILAGSAVKPIRTTTISYCNYFFRKGGRRDINDAFTTFTDQTETVITCCDHTTNEGWYKFHYGVPSHGHNILFVFVGRCDEDCRRWLQEASYIFHRKIFFYHINLNLVFVRNLPFL